MPDEKPPEEIIPEVKLPEVQPTLEELPLGGVKFDQMEGKIREEAAVPSWTPRRLFEQIVNYKSGTTYRLYQFIKDAWKLIYDSDNDLSNLPTSTEKAKLGEIVDGADTSIAIGNKNIAQILTSTDYTDLTDGGATTLHTHAGIGTSTKIYTSATDITVTNTTETNLVSVSIPGGTLGTDGAIRVKILASWTYVNANDQATFKLKYGATDVITFTTPGGVATFKGWMEFTLIAAGATNAQEGGTSLMEYRTNWEQLTSVGTAVKDSSAANTLFLSYKCNQSAYVETFTMYQLIVDKIN